MRQFKVSRKTIIDWLILSLKDKKGTVPWLNNAGLPDMPELGPCHMGLGAVLIPEQDQSEMETILSFGDALAWERAQMGQAKYPPDGLTRVYAEGTQVAGILSRKITEDVLEAAYARMIENRRIWCELFMRFTVYARWDRQDNHAGEKPDRKPSEAVLRLMNILNSELTLDVELTWQKPLPIFHLLQNRSLPDGGGVYIFSAKRRKTYIPLYTGIAGKFWQRFGEYTKLYWNQAPESGNKLGHAARWAKDQGLYLDDLFFQVANLPKAWYCGPIRPCYFRDGQNSRQHLQAMWAIDNLLATKLDESNLPLNTENRDQERRVLLRNRGRWPRAWPQNIFSPFPCIPVDREIKRIRAKTCLLWH